MALLIYEEVGKNHKLLSPSCHSIRMALDHMGIKAKLIGLTPAESKDLNIKFKSYPILKDGKRIIQSGFEVAKYLERNFPSAPTLFGGQAGTCLSGFINAYVNENLYPNLLGFLTEDILKSLEEKDQEIFLKNSKIILGNKTKAQYLLEFNKKLGPLRLTLKKQEFLCGERPAYADYMIYGLFAWAESLTDLALLNPRDSLNGWLNKKAG